MKPSLILMATAMLGSTAAQAVTITFGGISANGGTESRFVFASTQPVSPTTIFPDGRTSTSCSQSDPKDLGNDPAGHGSWDQYTNSVAKVRLAPSGTSTINGKLPTGGCYNVVNNNGPLIANGDPVTNDGYQNIGLTTGTPTLTYVGLIWGSPDSYNFLQFIDDAGNVVNTSNNFNGLGTTINGQTYLTGASIYGSPGGGGFTADPGNAGAIFVNFAFDTSKEAITGIRVGNFGNCCFEFSNLTYTADAVTDPTPNAGLPGNPRPPGGLPNVVVGRNALAVPEPTAGAAFLAGITLLALARRRRG